MGRPSCAVSGAPGKRVHGLLGEPSGRAHQHRRQLAAEPTGRSGALCEVVAVRRRDTVLLRAHHHREMEWAVMSGFVGVHGSTFCGQGW